MIAVRAPFCVAGKSAVLQPPLENFQRRQNKCDRHALCQVLKHGNKINDQVTVNPPVPATVLKLRV